MHSKATLANDQNRANAIMSSSNPAIHLGIGRRVIITDKPAWEERALQLMERGLLEKFKQNDDIRAFLMDTKGTDLAESSPTDTYWGIGLPMHAPNITNKLEWKGKNVLGGLMGRVRDALEIAY